MATILPSYLTPAMEFQKPGKRSGIVAFMHRVTFAAVEAIAGAVLVLGRRTIFADHWFPGWVKVAILLVTLGVILKFKKLPEPVIILAAALAGLIAFPLMQP